MYGWSVSNEDMATIDNEGHMETLDGPGQFNVRAFMPDSPHNFAERRGSSNVVNSWVGTGGGQKGGVSR